MTQYTNTEKKQIRSRGGEGQNIGRVSSSDSNYSWECLVQLASLQNPGTYLRRAQCRAGSREGRHREQGSCRHKIKITTDSLYPAKVNIFAETAKQAKKRRAYTAYLKWPKMVESHTVTIIVKPDGSIQKTCSPQRISGPDPHRQASVREGEAALARVDMHLVPRSQTLQPISRFFS